MKVVLGTQYGDEGKGRVVDLLADQAVYVVRYQGGANSGHTVHANGKQYVLHQIPSGIVNRKPACLITNGAAFDAEAYLKEKKELESSGVKTDGRLFISERAGLLFPWHRTRDATGAKGDLGTTGQGVGPFYEDNASRRRRINVGDLVDVNGKVSKDYFANRVREVAKLQNEILAPNLLAMKGSEIEKIIEKYLLLGKQLSSQVVDTSRMIRTGLEHSLDMLFEGAQAVLLDRDLGTGRYVTASSTGGGSIDADTGAPVTKYGLKRFGVFKAYMTRVGKGPFVTEDDDLGERRRKRGNEFGATTGRPRRLGWLDLVALKYAVETSGIDVLTLTKPDVLDGELKIKVCTAYELPDGTQITEMPSRLSDLEKCRPVYESFDGWNDVAHVRSQNKLHPNLRKYMELIENAVGVKIALVSTGPDRKDFTMLNGYKLSSLR